MIDQPNIYWRNAIRRGLSQFKPVSADVEADFLAYVEKLYQAEKMRNNRQAAPDKDQFPNLTLYILALAQLTYGHLEVVEDILRNLPPNQHPARVLARTVDALLPLPTHLSALLDAEATFKWIYDHRAQLRWKPIEGCFYMDESTINDSR